MQSSVGIQERPLILMQRALVFSVLARPHARLNLIISDEEVLFVVGLGVGSAGFLRLADTFGAIVFQD